MKLGKTLLSAILAGMCVGLGGVVFLAQGDKLVGAFFFTCGLFCVCTFGLKLFTGKVCYVFQNGRDYALELPVIWLGNLLGTVLVAVMMGATRLAPYGERAAELCRVKQEDSLGSLFLLGLLCNLFIYIAVESYAKNPHELGKYLGIFFGVMVFILSGYEHCVADMFYVTAAGAWSGDMLLRILVITAGNAAGGVLLPLCRGWIAKTDAK